MIQDTETKLFLVQQKGLKKNSKGHYLIRRYNQLLVMEVLVDRQVQQSQDLFVGHAGIHGFLLGDLSILVSIQLLHHSFSKCFTIPFSLHHLANSSNIPLHFFGIYEAILILIISLESPFDLILRSIIAHDTNEKNKLFQADHTVTISVKSIKQSLKILRSSHDSEF